MSDSKDRRDETTKNNGETLVAQMLKKHGKSPYIRHEEDDES